MNIIAKIKHWFTEAPYVEGTVIESERIGSRIQKVTIGLPLDVRGPFPMGSYIVAYTWGCIPRAYSIAKTDGGSFTLIVRALAVQKYSLQPQQELLLFV